MLAWNCGKHSPYETIFMFRQKRRKHMHLISGDFLFLIFMGRRNVLTIIIWPLWTLD